MSDISNLQRVRASYQPKLPRVLRDNGPCVRAVEGEATTAAGDAAAIEATFPHTYGLPMVTFEPGSSVPAKACRVGVILSGGQAPGGHNVIAGIFDGLKAANPESVLLGFLGGPSGLLKPAFEELTEATIDAYRNTGGFDIIGSGRTKIETDEQFAQAAANARDLGLDALVIIGGDDSNTNACLLAEYFLQNGVGTQVIGVPKTIDGDLKNALIETSFGFDTATKVYSELIGNIQRDANSAKKYWHFIKLMGRSASHIALECGLQTHANITIVSEEVAAENVTLKQIAEQVAGVVRDRAANGDNFGVVLIPEGLIEFIPEMKALIAELNDLLAEHDSAFKALGSSEARAAFVAERLGEASAAAFCSLPADIQMQLTMDRDPHGNVQVSRIETEKLVVTMVEEILAGWKTEGAYTGKFSSQCHFFGYEGRCAPPSNFDADYCYSLGYAACALILAGKTGYMSSVRNLSRPADEWAAGGVPLTMMMNMERRHGEDRPVIRKALVELDGRPFARLKELRASCTVPTAFVYPGPIQYFGPSEVCDQPSITLQLEQGA